MAMYRMALLAAVAFIVGTAALPAQAQPAVGRCPTVVSVPVQQYYYVPASQALTPTITPQQPLVYVGGYQPTVVFVIPQAPVQPAPSPFGARYDESGRIIATSTPQFDIFSPAMANTRFIFDETGRVIGTSTLQTIEPSGSSPFSPMMLGRPWGAHSFFETSSFGGTCCGGVRMGRFGE